MFYAPGRVPVACFSVKRVLYYSLHYKVGDGINEEYMARKKGKLHINRDWCKGCGICVHFCPTKVLVMSEFKAVAEFPDKCTACMMCELRCPDFAIEVEIMEAEEI